MLRRCDLKQIGAPQTGPVGRLWSHLTDGAAAVLH